MAFDRKVKMIVGPNLAAEGSGLDVSELDIEFEVTRSLTIADNKATFKVYNPKENTRNILLKVGNNIIFQAGYTDQGITTIFIGNIKRAYYNDISVDRFVEIEAYTIRSEKIPFSAKSLNQSFSPPVFLSTVIQDIGTAYTLVTSGLDLARIPLENGWSYIGTLKGAITKINKILDNEDSILYMDNSDLVVTKKDGTVSAVIATVSYGSGPGGGLKSLRENTKPATKKRKNPKQRWQFETIMISTLQPNGLIRFDTPQVTGSFLIEKLVFVGDNFGGDFGVVGEAVEPGSER